MRTKEQEVARFTWLTPGQVAAELAVDHSLILQHIHLGSFGTTEDDVLNVGTGARPEYRIHPDAYARFKKARRVKKAS